MDIVYPVRRGNHNDELRYSLRSLVNVPHGKVILSGYIPNWVTEVVAVDRNQKGTGWRNMRENLQAALEHCSDPFYLFNDDFYVMQPMQQIPVMHMGPFKDQIARYKRTRHMGAYWRGMVSTQLLLEEWGYTDTLSYELHVPMPLYKDHVYRALEIGKDIEALAIRSVIGNIGNLGGIQQQDCKVMARAGVLHWDQWPFLSSNDDLPYSPVGKYLARTFPDPSHYEHTQ